MGIGPKQMLLSVKPHSMKAGVAKQMSAANFDLFPVVPLEGNYFFLWKKASVLKHIRVAQGCQRVLVNFGC